MSKAITCHAVGLSIALAVGMAACGEQQPSQTPPPVSAPSAPEPAVKGLYGVYVTNEQSGDLTVIDPAANTVVATIPLGKRPRGIRAAPNGSQLYIALSGSPIAPPGVDESKLPPPDRTANGIGVLDVKTLKVETKRRFDRRHLRDDVNRQDPGRPVALGHGDRPSLE